jgi:pSer/pThr/pTyr-binding forkhead associated (FHA) protein
VHRLVLQTGPGTGEIFDAPQGTYVVGRAQLCSRDQHMSRRQAQITCVNGDLLIADSGGANPTLFDDKRIESPITLHPGARVRLGVSWATYLRQ